MEDWIDAMDAENHDKIAAIAAINSEAGAWLSAAYERDPNYYAEEVQRLYDYLFLIEE